MKTRGFDCVQMKHRGAEKVLEKIAGMTREQELEYWRERSQHLRARQQAMKNKCEKSAAYA